MKDYKFEPVYKKELPMLVSQERAKKMHAGELEPEPLLGEYVRKLPGRTLSFEKHGELLAIESQEEWDKVVEDAERILFLQTQYHEKRVAPKREMEQVTQREVDEIMEWEIQSKLQTERELEDLEENGVNSQLHLDQIARNEKGSFPFDLKYVIRNDIREHETTPEFRVYRKGMTRGYKEALKDVAYAESQIPELVEIRDRLRAEIVAAIHESYSSRFGACLPADSAYSLENDYVMNLPISALVEQLRCAKNNELKHYF